MHHRLPRGPAEAGGNWLSQGQDGQRELGRRSGAHQSGGAGPPTARCLPKAKCSPTPGQRPHGCNFQDGALTEPCSHASELCQQDTMVPAWEGPRRPAGNPALTSRSCQKPGHQGTREPIPCQLGAYNRKAFTDSNCLRGWGPGRPPPACPSLSAAGSVLGTASSTGGLKTDARQRDWFCPEDTLGCSRTAHTAGRGWGAEGPRAKRAR